MTTRLEGKSVFLTDIAGAFGEAIARTIVAERGKLAVGFHTTGVPSSQEIAHVPYDPANPRAWLGALDTAARNIGPLTSVVCNADLAIPGSIADLSLADWRKSRAGTLDPAMLAMRSALPRLRHVPGSSIILVASIASEIALAQHVSYSANAFALRPMARSAAIHAREKGYTTRINTVIAGFDKSGPLANEIPAAAVAAEHVAAMVAFLISDAAVGMTASEFTVDNGGSAVPA